ncbi:unnamed protein product [Brugia pahangi]|uniref:NB-ARC domain-containing protein n=1 Tax=Brugia pahangi TaxID=6280 RepID=A0A0N4TGF2_BRUPA|nr:unnamed protein product [Brugia pahangi]
MLPLNCLMDGWHSNCCNRGCKIQVVTRRPLSDHSRKLGQMRCSVLESFDLAKYVQFLMEPSFDRIIKAETDSDIYKGANISQNVRQWISTMCPDIPITLERTLRQLLAGNA